MDDLQKSCSFTLGGQCSSVVSLHFQQRTCSEHPSRVLCILLFSLLQPLDFETKSSFSLRIEATNRNIDSNFLNLGPFSDTTSVKVTVEDVNEPPLFSTALSKMVVSEDAKVGTSIGRVSAHDPDTSNNAIRYQPFAVTNYNYNSLPFEQVEYHS